MNIMKNIKYILTIFITVFFFTSCEEFLDVNDDPNSPANVSLDLRIKPMILLSNGAAQWRGSREIVAVTQYVASRQEANSPDIWNFSSSNFFWQNALVWSFPNAVDLTVYSFVKLSDTQIFKNTILYLLKIIMVLIQNLLGLVYI